MRPQKWWLEKNGEWYEALPAFSPSMVVRCATHYPDGQPIPDDRLPGCGSANVEWDGEVYDCFDCGLFFSDYAADPPHRRDELVCEECGKPVEVVGGAPRHADRAVDDDHYADPTRK